MKHILTIGSRYFFAVRLQLCAISSTSKNIVELPEKSKSSKDKIVGNYCTPHLNEEERNEVKSVVGINITYNSISWARLQIADNNVTDLNLQILPEEINKMDLNTLYFTVDMIVRRLPLADMYCMENVNKQISGNTGKALLTAKYTQIQLISMLIALINSQLKSSINRYSVMFLKPRIAARLFNILIGTEKVSTEPIVQNIFSGKEFYGCVPVTVNNNIAIAYKTNKSAAEKEILGQALLLTLCFYNIAINKNNATLNRMFLIKGK